MISIRAANARFKNFDKQKGVVARRFAIAIHCRRYLQMSAMYSGDTVRCDNPLVHPYTDKTSGFVNSFSYIVSLVLILKCDEVRRLVRVSPCFN